MLLYPWGTNYDENYDNGDNNGQEISLISSI